MWLGKAATEGVPHGARRTELWTGRGDPEVIPVRRLWRRLSAHRMDSVLRRRHE
jgi:hypothetical protein